MFPSLYSHPGNITENNVLATMFSRLASRPLFFFDNVERQHFRGLCACVCVWGGGGGGSVDCEQSLFFFGIVEGSTRFAIKSRGSGTHGATLKCMVSCLDLYDQFKMATNSRVLYKTTFIQYAFCAAVSSP